jgi:hypothetical protein
MRAAHNPPGKHPPNYKNRKDYGMDDDRNGGSGGWPRRAGLARAGVVAAAVAGIALLAACGGGNSPAPAGNSGTYQTALAFARCMRSHGEPSWPDPTSSGTFSTSGIDIASPQFSSASSACMNLRPAHGVHLQLSAAQQQALLKQGLKYAACMRAHGVASFPDPEAQDVTAGAISFSTKGLAPPGQKLTSPQFLAANKACEPIFGGGS